MVREQGLLKVTISGVDCQNAIGFPVDREVLQVFLVHVEFRLVGRGVYTIYKYS